MKLLMRFFGFLIKKCDETDDQMEGSGLTFKLVSSLSIRYEKVNNPRASSFIRSLNWYKNIQKCYN